MNQLTINNAIVELFIGELVNTNYDAVVISCNSRLLPSGDTTCNVLRNAGSSVQVECNKIMLESSNVPIGGAVITSGGNLGSKYIIHTRAGHDGKKLMLATWNSLKLADIKKIESIVFPPILKDYFTAKKCANIMLPTIYKYLSENNKNLVNVSICLETLPDYKEFEEKLDELV